MSENQRSIFVNNLKNAMQRRGVTQSDIVASLGISASTVSDWCTGKNYPRVDAMQRLASFLGVLLSDLTTEHADVTGSPGEAELIGIFRGLNDLGQVALLSTARGLAANPDMKKAGASNGATA